MTARYTAAELVQLADDRGPFFADNARQALRWAARVLDAADEAVQAERLRAEEAATALPQAVRNERDRCAKKPLTAQQLDKLIEAHVGGSDLADGEYSAMVMFAAAVEQAHGIVA